MANFALPQSSSMPRIDAHHHFWQYTQEEYPWIDPSMAALRRDFLVADLEPLANASAIDGVVSIQARQTLEETLWLLQIAEVNSLVRGVVGWAPIASPLFAATLETLREQPLLKGLRHILQAEPAAYMLESAFNHGLALLKDTGLVYDLLITEQQLPQAITLVDGHPSQPFVLDHLAKPSVASGVIEPWQTHIRELAKRPHVYCKLSGLVTEAVWQQWTPNDLRPYIDTVLECFGPQRLMVGSDWPVCTVASTYSGWFKTLQTILRELSSAEQAQIFGGTATSIYQLNARRP